MHGYWESKTGENSPMYVGPADTSDYEKTQNVVSDPFGVQLDLTVLKTNLLHYKHILKQFFFHSVVTILTINNNSIVHWRTGPVNKLLVLSSHIKRERDKYLFSQ